MAALAAGTVLVAAPAAYADEVDGYDDLAQAVSDCDADTVTLGADITESSEVLAVDCAVTLDLNGNALQVNSVEIRPEQALTITDSSTNEVGSLVANSSRSHRSGISVATGATLVIAAGTVNANGRDSAAGIGTSARPGDDGADLAGEVMITGGTVTTSSDWGAGIGGGDGAGLAGQVTITGGTVTATGVGGAGIGGGWPGGDGADLTGEVTITGGTVTTSSDWAAGIGGGDEADLAGQVTITGGTVAASSDWGAGIGGGSVGDLTGEVTITGGTVTATGLRGAGIGGGDRGDGSGAVVVGEGATVVAQSGNGSAIGPGRIGSGFGSLTVSGDLHLPPTGVLDIKEETVEVSETGRILGEKDNEISGAQILGSGEFDNAGVIALDAALVLADDVSVTGHHHHIEFESQGGDPEADPVTVFAESFTTGFRDWPTEDPTKPGYAFSGWNTEADGSGETFDTDTILTGSSEGAAVPHQMFAQFQYAEGTIDPDLDDDVLTFIAGEPGHFTPQLMVDGDPAPTDPGNWDATDPNNVLEIVPDPETGEITVGGTQAGQHTLVVSYDNGWLDLEAEVTVSITAAVVTELDLEASATGVDQGQSVTIAAAGADEFGNSHGDVTGDVTWESSVATDVIDGNTVTFGSASEHVITATHVDGASADITITVNPATTDDADEAEEVADVEEAADEAEEGVEEAAAGTLPALGAGVDLWAVPLAFLLVGAGSLALRMRRQAA